MKTYTKNGFTWAYGQKAGYKGSPQFWGPCPACGSATFDYGGNWRCVDLYCSNSWSNPAPSLGAKPAWWNTNINVFMDGNAWCATMGSFINLQESPAGFGNSPDSAVKSLLSCTSDI